MTPDPATPGRRLTRAESTALTRERLLDAGREVFVEQGYAPSSIYAIAERAGRTIGALYSQFGNKENLFLELWDRHITQMLQRYTAAAQGRDPQQASAVGGQVWAELLTQDPMMFRLFIEFWAQALRDPALRERLVSALGRWRAEAAALVTGEAERFGVRLAVPAEHVAVAIEALIDGFSLHALADPDHVDPTVLGTALGWLIAGLVQHQPS